MCCSINLWYSRYFKKIVSFERNLEFNSVKTNKKNLGNIFSGISIIKTNLIARNFRLYNNFEKEFYQNNKKNNTNFEEINGFWHSIDNEKDIKNLNKKAKK